MISLVKHFVRQLKNYSQAARLDAGLGFAILIASVFLSACSTTAPAQPSPSIVGQPSASQAVMPISTDSPDGNLPKVSDPLVATQGARATQAAEFPFHCETFQTQPEGFSPDGLWLVESCFSDQGAMLMVISRDGQYVWKLWFRDYIQITGEYGIPEGMLEILYWSTDGRYMYFSPSLVVDGGDCYLGDLSWGLSRLDLRTGDVSALLPYNADYSGYLISFSPTGRRYVFAEDPNLMNIVDLQTGEHFSLQLTDPITYAGAVIWSPDGLSFAFSTVTYPEDSSPTDFGVRIIDTSSRTMWLVTSSRQYCLYAQEWTETNVIILEGNFYSPNPVIIYYDVGRRVIIATETAVPGP